MPLHLRNWLLKQMNARDTLDGVALAVKLAVTEFGTKRVVRELRSWAEYLERWRPFRVGIFRLRRIDAAKRF